MTYPQYLTSDGSTQVRVFLDFYTQHLPVRTNTQLTHELSNNRTTKTTKTK